MLSNKIDYKYNFIFSFSLFCLLLWILPFKPVVIFLDFLMALYFIYYTVYRRRWKIRLSLHPRELIVNSLWTGSVLIVLYEVFYGQKMTSIHHFAFFVLLLSSFSIFVCISECAKKINIRVFTFRKGFLSVFLLVVAFLFTALCSRSSWLYTINDSSDPNIFFSVGKSVMQGNVLYKDIFEQKGPYIFLLHGIASLISSTSMVGVFWIEVVVNWIFLMIGRKIIRLYVKNDWISLIGIPIGFAIYVASYCFWYGDNAEELCSPFLIYGMYILLNCLKENSLPSKQEYFAIGMTSGFILWVKYTMLGFYLGWYIVPFVLMVKRKKWKEILRSIGWIAFGVFMISLPVLVYFVWNHALRYLWEVYFYDNIFLYTTKAADQMFFMTVLRALKMNVTQNFWLSLLIFFSFVWMYFQTSLREFLGYLCCFLGLIFSTYIGGRYYPYYYSCLGLFMFPGLVYGYSIVRKWTEPLNPFILTGLTLCGCVGFMFLTSRNTAYINQPAEEYPQYQFAKIMNQIENPTLLNYKMLDSGFNLYADISPTNRFYCKFNVPLPEMIEEQKQILENGEVDFFISYDSDLPFEKYRLIASQNYNRGEGVLHYNLYGKKDLPLQTRVFNKGEENG